MRAKSQKGHFVSGTSRQMEKKCGKGAKKGLARGWDRLEMSFARKQLTNEFQEFVAKKSCQLVNCIMRNSALQREFNWQQNHLFHFNFFFPKKCVFKKRKKQCPQTMVNDNVVSVEKSFFFTTKQNKMKILVQIQCWQTKMLIWQYRVQTHFQFI